MKQILLKTCLILVCMLVGVGTMWGEEETITLANGSGSGSGTSYSITWSGTSCNITQTKENSTTSVNSSYISAPRWYQGHIVSFKAKSGYTLTGATVVCTSDSYATALKNSTYSTGASATVSSSTVTITTNGDFDVTMGAQSRISSIKITYTTSGGSTPEPTKYTVTVANDIANGTVTANPTSAAEGATVTLTATPNDGYEFGSWNVTNASTSAAITVTDNKFTMPAANVNVSATFNAATIKNDYATLPFNWNGGTSSDFTNLDGVKASGLGSDYASGNAPYLIKLDNTGDYFQIKSNEAIGVCSVNVKMIGGNTTSSLKVSESTDGIKFTDVESLSISGAQNAVVVLTTTKSLNTASRYVRFTFTKGSNVGVGAISIAQATPTTPSDKTLIGIESTGTPAELWKDDAFNHDGITITATWDDESESDVTSDCNFSGYDMSTAGEQTVTVTYQGKSTTYTINVKTIANTQETAYTVAQAKALIDANKDLNTEVYVKGTVSKVDSYNETYGSITYWLDNDAFEVYGGLNNNGEKFSSIDDVEVGAQVVVKGKITKYGSNPVIYEFAQKSWLVSYTAPVQKTITALAVSGTPTKTTYNVGDAFETAGLEVTATYSDESTATITEGITWKVTPETLNEGTTSVSVTATVNGITSVAYTVNGLIVTAASGGDMTLGDYVITTIDKIDVDDEVVIVFTNNTASYAMSNDKGTGDAPAAVEVVIVNNTIASAADNILWNVNYSDGTFVIYPNGITEKWLYCTSTNNGVRVGTNDNNKFNIKDDYLYHTTTERYLGVYNNADVRCYTSINSNISNQTLAFYVKKAAPKVLASIALSGTYKTEFFQNDEFCHDGVVVTAIYDDESTKDVTANANFSTPDMTNAGTQTITVSYTEGEVTKTATYDINVAAEELTSISLGGSYTTNFEQNGTFNHNGLTVTAHYNSGRTADVTADATVSSPDLTTLGEQTVTVSFGDQEATYTIKVVGYYTVTIDNTNDTNGTISVWNGDVELASGAQVLGGTELTIKYTVITENYRFKNWQYKDNSVDKWTSKTKNFDYKINDSDVSFRANFEAIPEYTITYYVNGVPTTETLREGTSLNFPENPTLVGKVFRGWITDVKVANKDVEPEYVSKEATATANDTYFAVFATETITEGETGSDVWEKVPHDYTNWLNGDDFILVYENSETEAYVFNGKTGYKNYATGEIKNGNTIDVINGKFVNIHVNRFNETSSYTLEMENEPYPYILGDKDNGIIFYKYDENIKKYVDSNGKEVNRTVTDIRYDKTYGWVIDNSNSWLRYDSRNSTTSQCFKFFKHDTAQKDEYKSVEFYVKKAGTESVTTYSDFTTNMDVIERKELNEGQYFTICYPHAVHPKAYAGATPYNIVGRIGSSIELEEETGDLVAGCPYFMVGSSDVFTGYYSLDNAVETAGKNNGLIGTFDLFAFADHTDIFDNDAEIYVVLDTNIKKAYPTGGGVVANRAYIDLNQVKNISSSPSRIAIELEGATPTDIEGLTLSESDNTIFNLQGQRMQRLNKGVNIINGRKVIR